MHGFPLPELSFLSMLVRQMAYILPLYPLEPQQTNFRVPEKGIIEEA